MTGVLRWLRFTPFVDRSANRLKSRNIRPSLPSLRYFQLAILAFVFAHDAQANAFLQKVSGCLIPSPVDDLSVFEPHSRGKAQVGILLLQIE